MQFTGQLIRDCTSEVGQFSRWNRRMMNLSGYAIRIAGLLEATELVSPIRPVQGDNDAAKISLRGVDVRTPTGVALIDDLSLTVRKGESLMITGKNGVGKTSLFRVLKQMWPTSSGQVGCPASTMFLPQTPHLSADASLQDQITYPQRVDTKLELRELLSTVNLEHLLDKKMDQNETAAIDWSALSLGERQQLAIARVLFKLPDFCVLDEATGAISQNTEARLIDALKRRGVTLITVTHSSSLLPYHENLMRIEGGESKADRSWTISQATDQDAAGFASPVVRSMSTLDRRAEAAAEKAVEASRLLAERSKGTTARSSAGRAMPVMTDLKRTGMLLRLALPQISLKDESVLRLLGYMALMVVSVRIQTGFMSGVFGQLQSLAIQGNVGNYWRFQARVMGTRLVSPLISAAQQWLRSGVTIIWRERMSQAIQERYIANRNFYHVRAIDRRILDTDTRIAQEIPMVVQQLSMMVPRMIRPLFDAAYCTVLLIQIQLPAAGLVAIWLYGICGIGILRFVSPDFALFESEDARASSEFRAAHDRVSTNAEAIAFSDGGALEEMLANAHSDEVLKIYSRKNDARAYWNVVDMFFRRRMPNYISQVLRMFWSFGQGSNGEVLEQAGGTKMSADSQFIGSLISNTFDVCGDFLGMAEDFQQLFGNVRRVTDVLLVIEEIEEERLADAARISATQQPPTPRRGQRISLDGARLTAPDGQVVAQALSFSVEANVASNLLVTGPNGAGKSALVRVLSGLWSVSAGTVVTPSGLGSMVVIPQTPLVPTAPLSLLDMCTYPEQLAGAKQSEAIPALSTLLDRLKVGYLVDRTDDGWHSVQQWEAVLSMGEAQALAMVRALHHKPAFMILDEATSAMSEDVATEVYHILQDSNISVLSVAQSESAVRSFHNQELRLGEANGDGWAISAIGDGTSGRVLEFAPEDESLPADFPSGPTEVTAAGPK